MSRALADQPMPDLDAAAGPQHFLGVDASTINTRPFALTARAVSDLLRLPQSTGHCAMAAFTGDAGLGKTFAVQSALSHHAAETIWTDFPSRASMRRVAATVYGALTGEWPEFERFRLDDLLIPLLGERERVVVVDEAQRLNHECFEYLRHLHDDPRTRFTLLLVGGQGCWQVISRHRMLRSRMFRQVDFEPMSSAEVLAALPNFHRIYADARREDIIFADDHFAHGNLRDWASFTLTAAQLCEEQAVDRLDRRVIANCLALLGGGAADAA